MPCERDLYETVSYITAAGDEIILSDPGLDKWWETVGRSGFKAPEVRPESRVYANGASRTLAVLLERRSVSLQMVIRGMTRLEAVSIYQDLVSRLVQVGAQDEWGRLVLRKADGTFVHLNCVYTGGMNISETLPRIFQFSLTFEAGDAYFYDEAETVRAPARLESLIYLSDDLTLGDWELTDGLTDIEIVNTGEIFYPVFEVTGPASVIRVTNTSTGKTLAMASDFSLLSGETLTIDCRENRRRITLLSSGAETDVSHKLALGSSLIFPILKGTNLLNFYYTDIQDSSAFRTRYQKRYLSA